MNIFVSYTTRNNEVTVVSLANFSTKVSSLGKTFIDLLDNNSIDKQGRIIQELEDSDILILIKSQSTYKSEWVKLELESANKMNIPVIEFQISEIDSLTEEAIKNRILNLWTTQSSRLQSYIWRADLDNVSVSQ
jgi:hypothetical protein